MNYQQAAEQLVGRCRDRRKIANNTYLVRRDSDEIAVRLHATDVLTFFADGRIRVNTGGYHTVTTVDRINAFLPGPWRVSRHRGLTLLYKMHRTVARINPFLPGPWRVSRYRGLTILYQMHPTAWTPICTVDNSCEISSEGETDGGDVQAYFASVRAEDNSRNRIRNRGRYWQKKVQEGKPAKGLTVANIMAKENATVRVCKMRLYGIEKFFLDANPKIIDAHGDYQLLSLPLTRWSNMLALKMVCPSTRVAYVSPVNPRVQSVSEALDWVFQMPEGQHYLEQVVQQS